MKSKTRRIEVDGQPFAWRVTTLSTDPGIVRLRIWADGRKDRPWADVHCRFDDVWLWGNATAEQRKTLQLEPLRPGHVADIIRRAGTLIAQGPVTDMHRCFELAPAGELLPIENRI